ncbi:hypothetical protein Zmor_001845 [Zophobas morio]|uniref:Uncharacterized protein n=1 Tax=Zophobas morio TaxID=2755281 RepID=A0AA38I5G1_9CUCU|nr:hypothetical protein Zmor_021523 [Zophobas morio]KAJ3666402.1 hypothetical protein Zmor_001845 [Zophobas morio]
MTVVEQASTAIVHDCPRRFPPVWNCTSICRRNASGTSIYRCCLSFVEGIPIVNATMCLAASLIANGFVAAITGRPRLQPASAGRPSRCVLSRLSTGLMTGSGVDSYL